MSQQVNDTIDDYLKSLIERISSLEAALKRLEWTQDGDECPVCGRYDPSSAAGQLYRSMVGHAPDCWLAAAIKEAE